MDSKYHKSYSDRDYNYFTYSSAKGKFGISNLLLETLVEDFSTMQCRLFLAILSRIKQSDDFFESGVVRLVSNDYLKYCSRNSFGPAVKKFVKFNFLVPTPKSKVYILNPLYVNKFYKTKIKK